MRFVHAADCHLGGHRDPKLRYLSERAFERLVTETIAAKVDFLLIAGDLFNTAIPGIDALKFTVTQLTRLSDAHIPVYAIPGSHDFSPSGKTMLDVLEEAHLLTNVAKGAVHNGVLKLAFTVDPATKVRLTGIPGRRGMLDKSLYEDLDRSIESEPGEKIFLFHTALDELVQNSHHGNGASLSLLPRGFGYYAGGHVHITARHESKGYGTIVYPGPLFPNSFFELEELTHGGYMLYENGVVQRRALALKPVAKVHCSVNNLTGEEANALLQNLAQTTPVQDAIVLLRIEGVLSAGGVNDLDLRQATRVLLDRGAYTVLRNTVRLTTASFEGVEIERDTPEDIEETLLTQHATQFALPGYDGMALARSFLRLLSREAHEGENLQEYREIIVQESLELLENRKEGPVNTAPGVTRR